MIMMMMQKQTKNQLSLSENHNEQSL